mgnify:CR=1 FL=1|jgi:Uncharacterized protein conserved in cyanobacteria
MAAVMTAMTAPIQPTSEVVYPESDGRPMADNTKQYRWITTIQGNLDLLYQEQEDVFVAGDLLWYPVEGNNRLATAPDVLVAFGRPRGDRGSYRQWEEGGVAPQVVFEILSPSSRMREMALKFDFYDRFGVEEYYLYDPETFDFSAWVRQGDRLRAAEYTDTWVSPRMSVRFELPEGQEMRVFYPDGRPFLTFLQIGEARKRAEERAEKLADKLRELGIDPETV